MSLICWENEDLSDSIHRFTIGIVSLLQCVSKDACCVCSPSSSEVRVFPDDLWIYVVVDVDSVWSCAIWSVFPHGAISVGYLCLRHLYYRVFRVRSDVSLFFRFFFYMIGFALLSMSIALPFPCSSSVIQHSIDPSCILRLALPS